MKSDKLSIIFQKQGYVSFNIEKFFPELNIFSEEFHNIDEEYWSWIIKNKYGEHDFYLKKHDQLLIENEKTSALSDYESGLFSFSFRRIIDNDIGKSVACFHQIKSIVNSMRFLKFLEHITGRELKKNTVIYLNKFDCGDFLTVHSDPGQSIGLVINFTLNWNMTHGGLTMILDQSGKKIIDTLIPDNMTALIFDTGKKNIPHFVSMVTAKTQNKRIALVARYD
ncbi:2OG-Fe(II) oxygenase family protein [Morganella morganii]|uniref:2OG-Fe(II) oxygenase family protein n=1 Tax=Morganella morganii TaxID=582 RepID=UPI00128C7836|nr:2OG-Fe(II) oxygenase family protein [Morganella morganii]ELA7735640.1 hypothetical protein [Morganella morganii]ELA7737508.1 hypothetical protein [Morganella morganii]MDW7782119.1 2OG-Fe(II) oxygenase family protein [Morganella morganii]MDW7790240.1 2OG-Fe(II) oxygenase family protein [Morganella morganii]MQC07897.1 hypothetical protein [Morganella morganii]